MSLQVFCKNCGQEIDHYECIDGINHCPVCYNNDQFSLDTKITPVKNFTINITNKNKLDTIIATTVNVVSI